VAYCTILDSVPSAESCSSSSNGSTGLEFVMASPPLVLDMHFSAELLHMTEARKAEAAKREVAVATKAHAASPEGWFS
jgi:hypothetical protein